MQNVREILVTQFDAALEHYKKLLTQALVDKRDGQGISNEQWAEAAAFQVAAVCAIESSAGNDSTRAQTARRYVDEFEKSSHALASPAAASQLQKLKGVVDETYKAFTSGYLASIQELIRQEFLTNLLAEAEELHPENANAGDTKNAAAVIAGTALELHIKRLCLKYSIALANAGRMNDDLKKAGVYEKLEHHQVQFWQSLRNDAAHGNFDNFDRNQVLQMIQGVRNFIAKHPA